MTLKLDVMVHACYPKTWRMGTGGSEVQDQPRLHEALPQNQNNKYTKQKYGSLPYQESR